MPAKGDQEVMYFGPGQPCAGLDYSLPYNCLAPNSLAPGTVNTSQINGFVTSSPWLADNPYITAFAPGEWIMGFFSFTLAAGINNILNIAGSGALIVTNVGVYLDHGPTVTGGNLAPNALVLVHTWSGGEINASLAALPGNAVSFITINGTTYFTSLVLNGIFSISGPASGVIFAQATSYVTGAYLAELGGRMIVAECRFPGGGGTGTTILPTVAWSGVGEYAGTGASDPWDPANFTALNGNVGGFNLLSDVPDQITGLAGMGQSAIIFRNSGLTQADPNPGSANAGIQPFNFYHLWSSPQGVGALKGTVAQWGYTTYFESSDNVYSLNLSAGPQPIGPRIIPRILNDIRIYNNQIPAQAFPYTWNFSSIVNIAGQLHYLLTFSAYYTDTFGGGDPFFVALVYDFNISENSWHIWDMSQYIQEDGTRSIVLAFSCPIFQTEVIGYSGLSSINNPGFILTGFFSSFGTPSGSFSDYVQTGTLRQFIPWEYDFDSNWITNFVALLYEPVALPVTNITFRAEVVTLGHKNAQRRLRIQADNAPIPLDSPTIQQQQATVTFRGALKNNVQQSPLNWTFGSGPNETVRYMQGNYPPQGMPIQTYYADLVLNDEMIQSTLQSNVVDTANPWNSLPAFRLSSASLVLVDTKSTTQ